MIDARHFTVFDLESRLGVADLAFRYRGVQALRGFAPSREPMTSPYDERTL